MRKTTFNLISSLACICFLAGCASKQKIVLSDVKDSSGKNIQNINFSFFEGLAEEEKQNYNEAIHWYEEVLKIDPAHAAAHFLVAKNYLNLGQPQKGIPHALKSVQLDRQNVWYRRLLSELYEQNNQVKNAIENYQQLLKDFPNQINVLYELANLYIYSNLPLKALEIYQEIEKKSGVSTELSMQKQSIYTRLGKYDEAIEEIRKLIRFYPDNMDSYVLLAELYLLKKDEPNAVIIYEDILVKDPSHAYALLSLADYFRKKGEVEKSDMYIHRAFNEESVSLDTKIKIVTAYLVHSSGDSTRLAKAEDFARKLFSQFPDEAKVFSLMGDVCYNTGKKDSARILYKKVIEKEPDKIPVWQQILFIDLDLKHYGDLKGDSEKALEVFPNQTIFLLFNGLSRYYMKDYEGAIEVYKSAVRIGTSNTDILLQIYSSLGDAYQAVKDYAKSDDAFEKALSLNSSHANTLNNFAYYLSLRNNKLDEAERMAKKAVEIEPKVAAYLDTMGWILYKKNKFSEAKEWIKKSIDAGGASGAVYEHYGDVLSKLGDNNGATEYWRKAKEKGEGSDFLDQKISTGRLVE